MSDADESIKKELIKAGVDLAKLVYDDAIQPLARETGQALGTVGKTVNVALAPLRGLVWSWDQIEVFVTRKITEKLEQRNVPPARIRPPNPDIAIPAIEALRYSQRNR